MLRDPLTGLPNRMAFDERITLEINRCKRNHENICIAMWDIDHFKKVNDTYGHDAGDRVLKLLAQIINTRVRKVDMFSRIGGEEFVILLPQTSYSDAFNVANNLRKKVEQNRLKVKTQDKPLSLTISAGVSIYQLGEDLEYVMDRADKALYQAKNSGRNKVCGDC